MNSTETIHDILVEMRGNEWDDPHLSRSALSCARRIVRNYADRIETAWKHEKAKIEGDALAAGGLVEALRQKRGKPAKGETK